jgi:hypothetical protein
MSTLHSLTAGLAELVEAGIARITNAGAALASIRSPRDVRRHRLFRSGNGARIGKTNLTINPTHYVASELDVDAWVNVGIARLERYLTSWQLFTELYPADAPQSHEI